MVNRQDSVVGVAGASHRTCEKCVYCHERIAVHVAAFTWGGKRQLQWNCQSCRHVWITPERRADDRLL